MAAWPDLSTAADSPDPGPPPVAHFDEGGPVKRNPLDEKIQTSPMRSESATGQDGPAAFLSSNLETRRRRKQSSSGHDLLSPVEETPAPEDTAKSLKPLPIQPLRAGAKRKLGATEDDNQKSLSKSVSQEDLASHHRQGRDNQEPRPLSRSKSSQGLSTVRPTSKDQSSSGADRITSIRKALGESKVPRPGRVQG